MRVQLSSQNKLPNVVNMDTVFPYSSAFALELGRSRIFDKRAQR